MRYPCTDSRITIMYNIIFEYERLGMRCCYIISFFQTTWELGPSARSKGQSIQLLLRQMMPIRVSDCYFLSIIRINYTSSRTKPTRERHRCVIRRPAAVQLYYTCLRTCLRTNNINNSISTDNTYINTYKYIMRIPVVYLRAKTYHIMYVHLYIGRGGLPLIHDRKIYV